MYCLLIHSLSNTLRGDPHLLPKADPVKHQQVCVNYLYGVYITTHRLCQTVSINYKYWHFTLRVQLFIGISILKKEKLRSASTKSYNSMSTAAMTGQRKQILGCQAIGNRWGSPLKVFDNE